MNTCFDMTPESFFCLTFGGHIIYLVGIFSIIFLHPVAKNDTSCAISLKDLASETVVVEQH